MSEDEKDLHDIIACYRSGYNVVRLIENVSRKWADSNRNCDELPHYAVGCIPIPSEVQNILDAIRKT